MLDGNDGLERRSFQGSKGLFEWKLQNEMYPNTPCMPYVLYIEVVLGVHVGIYVSPMECLGYRLPSYPLFTFSPCSTLCSMVFISLSRAACLLKMLHVFTTRPHRPPRHVQTRPHPQALSVSFGSSKCLLVLCKRLW